MVEDKEFAEMWAAAMKAMDRFENALRRGGVPKLAKPAGKTVVFRRYEAPKALGGDGQ